MKLIILLGCIGIPVFIDVTAAAQESNDRQATLSGVVVDTESGERLSGVTIRDLESESGVISNYYGFFSLTSERLILKTFEVRHVGYSSRIFKFSFAQDSVFTLGLNPETTLLNEIEVAADGRRNSYLSGLGRITLSADKIRQIPSFGSEPDILKALQFFPGVQSGNEGTTNLSVRGGSFDQNLVLLDEAPIYNTSHALSFFSVFNIDAIQSVDFYKSEIPIKYGGRLSSVLDIRMREGTTNTNSVRGSVGVVSSRLTTEGPLSNNGKWSYILSGRYSYAGHVVNGIYYLGQRLFNDPTANRSTTDNRINFYDFNGKVNFSPNRKNRFYISTYSGNDKFLFNHITSGYDLSWGNRTSTFRWNHIHNNKLFSNSTLTNSRYDYEYRLLNNTQYFLWTSRLTEQQIKQDYDWYVSAGNQVTFGWGIQNYRIDPGKVTPRGTEPAYASHRLAEKNALSFNLYLGNTSTITPQFQFTYGVRLTSFGLRGHRTEYKYTASGSDDRPIDSITTSMFKPRLKLEPRIAAKYAFQRSKLTISYDRTSQFLHLLANSSIGLPTDIWWPSSENIKPQVADIYAVSFEKPLGRMIEFQSSIFFKSLSDVLDFKDNARLFINKHVENQLLQGRGTAFGSEVFLVRNHGKLTGSVSYTYSKSFSIIRGVNGGRRFPNRYDKRHNVSMMAKYPISDKFVLSSNFVLTSGGALTMPVGSFVFDGVAFNTYENRNNYRLPTYHRLDLSIKYHNLEKDKIRKVRRYWTLDIYNVYGRKNPFTMFAIQEDYGFATTSIQALYLYRIVPTISYNFEF